MLILPKISKKEDLMETTFYGITDIDNPFENIINKVKKLFKKNAHISKSSRNLWEDN